jgi:hypothetical protein
VVEQKNGAIVRRLVGYGRLERLLAAEILARLYAAGRLYGNRVICFSHRSSCGII